MSGVDKDIPELRPSEFKGMMRFWWRALHPHLRLDELRKQEGIIFGSSQENIGKSKFSIIIKPNPNLQTFKTEPVPTKMFKQIAILPDQTFEIILRFRDKKYFKTVLDIMMISTILGGFGRRSRRGFGSIKIIKINNKPTLKEIQLKKIKEILNSFLKKEVFVESNNNILVRNDLNQLKAKYPFIKEIYLGKENSSYDELLKKIAQSAHHNDCEQTGFTRQGERFASPIYVSTIENNQKYQPIITKLNEALNRKFYTKDHSEKFIDEILN